MAGRFEYVAVATDFASIAPLRETNHSRKGAKPAKQQGRRQVHWRSLTVAILLLACCVSAAGCRLIGKSGAMSDEIAACRPYLDRQIELIHPKVIVALGKSAATTLLNVEATIASLRGRVHRYAGVPLVVTYHPAYLLRNLPDKQKAWEDLLFARRTLREAAEARAEAPR